MSVLPEDRPAPTMLDTDREMLGEEEDVVGAERVIEEPRARVR